MSHLSQNKERGLYITKNINWLCTKHVLHFFTCNSIFKMILNILQNYIRHNWVYTCPKTIIGRHKRGNKVSGRFLGFNHWDLYKWADLVFLEDNKSLWKFKRTKTLRSCWITTNLYYETSPSMVDHRCI